MIKMESTDIFYPHLENTALLQKQLTDILVALIWNIVLSYKSNKLIYHMYDKDGQHPLPKWALGPGATVCDLCAYVCRSLLDRSRLSLPPTLYDISEITIFSFLC